MLTVLIADDTNTDRLILESLVKQLGYNTITATDGKEAVALFKEAQPEIVLLDVLMPVMDGYEAARTIKALTKEAFVPVLFLTSLTDTDSLVACLEAGGDDFIPKPYNKPILQAKMTAFSRIHELQSTLLSQRNQLRHHHQVMIQEQNIARHVFDNIAGKGCLDNQNIRYVMSSYAVFNGDVLVAAMRPNGNLMLMLGDFTGHGLPAAIGSMPLATTFYGMVGKGFSLRSILREINAKLKQMLPSGIFCCALFIEVDYHQGVVRAWNGGLPAAYLYRAGTGNIEIIKSKSLPLGLLNNEKLNDTCHYFEILQPQDRLFLWTDGIHEARSPEGDMFGEQRLLDVFHRGDPHKPEGIFDDILAAINQHVGGELPDDDLSLVEVILRAEPGSTTQAAKRPVKQGLIDWSLSLTIKPPTFQNFDPLPLLMTIISDVPGLSSRSEDLYTVLYELYSNALDHGLLQMSRMLSPSCEDVGEYDQLRQERLSQLQHGSIQFQLEHVNQGESGVLTLTIRDTGKGFDYARYGDVALQQNPAYSVRGIGRARRVCDLLTYSNGGSTVQAKFTWQNE